MTTSIVTPLDNDIYREKLEELRNTWQFPVLIQFVVFFHRMFKDFPETIYIENVEEELLGIESNPTIWPAIELGIIKWFLDSSKRSGDIDTDISRIFEKKGLPLEYVYSKLDICDKVACLQALTLFISHEDRFRMRINQLFDPTIEPELRIEPIGYRGDFGQYFIFDDFRLYYREDVPADDKKVAALLKETNGALQQREEREKAERQRLKNDKKKKEDSRKRKRELELEKRDLEAALYEARRTRVSRRLRGNVGADGNGNQAKHRQTDEPFTWGDPDALIIRKKGNRSLKNGGSGEKTMTIKEEQHDKELENFKSESNNNSKRLIIDDDEEEGVAENTQQFQQTQQKRPKVVVEDGDSDDFPVDGLEEKVDEEEEVDEEEDSSLPAFKRLADLYAAYPEPSWRCVCWDLASWRLFIDSLQKSKDRNEKSFLKDIKNGILKSIEEHESERIAETLHRMKERSMTRAISMRKKSSRIEAKMAERRHQEQLVRSAEEEARMTRRQKAIEREKQSYIASRGERYSARKAQRESSETPPVLIMIPDETIEEPPVNKTTQEIGEPSENQAEGNGHSHIAASQQENEPEEGARSVYSSDNTTTSPIAKQSPNEKTGSDSISTPSAVSCSSKEVESNGQGNGQSKAAIADAADATKSVMKRNSEVSFDTAHNGSLSVPLSQTHRTLTGHGIESDSNA